MLSDEADAKDSSQFKKRRGHLARRSGEGGGRLGQFVQPGFAIRRAHGYGSILAPFGGSPRQAVRIVAGVDRVQERDVVDKIVGDENQDQQIRVRPPHEFVVKACLRDLPSAHQAPGRRGDVEFGEASGGEFLQSDVEFLVYGDLKRLHQGIADYRDMAAFGGAFPVDGLAVRETQAVDPGDRPEVPAVGEPDL